jgi:hypothetical protein
MIGEDEEAVGEAHSPRLRGGVLGLVMEKVDLVVECWVG